MTNPANKGRNGDSMLVHMNPAEVGGLAALAEAHGRSMTINPETGYPEAFSLGDILPSIVGLGASVLMPQASPWLIGGLSGLTSYATSGSLEKGLLSGLTAGGLSALGGNLADIGAQAGGADIAQAAMPVTPESAIASTGSLAEAGIQAPLPGTVTPDFLASNPSYAAAMGYAPQAPTPGLMDGLGSRFSNMGKGINALMNPKEGGPTMGSFLTSNKGPLMAAGYGLTGSMALADDEARMKRMQAEEDARDAKKRRDYQGSVDTIRSNYAARGLPMPRVAFASGGMADAEKNKVYQDMALRYMDRGMEVPARLQQYLPSNNRSEMKAAPYNPYSAMFGSSIMGGNRSPWQPNINGSSYGGIFGRQNNSSPFAGIGNSSVANSWGGPFAGFGNRARQQEVYTGLEGLQGRNQNYQAPAQIPQAPAQPQAPAAIGADQILASMRAGNQAMGPTANPMVQSTDQILAGRQGFAMGGGVGQPRMISGAGDGLSDNVPATINGGDPAALSDGEFVIPADVVSHIGNGSSDAGAKRLYDMMDRIRSARTGTSSEPKSMDVAKVLPA